ncbi:hypothetical protein LCGC14_0720460 [marine sediment metagenome]|uniref:Uncharacterized protein n=1 Tax=marine sediment metagenome TaxID=412755 RepID=A0A0F9TJZ2_9ZZZZ
MTGVVDDVISHLNTNWNIAVTVKPSFLKGDKELAEGKAFIHVFDNYSRYTDATSDGEKRNEDHLILLIVGSKDTETKRDNMMLEVERICNIILTGYGYNVIEDRDNVDTSEGWKTRVLFKLKKFIQNKP